MLYTILGVLVNLLLLLNIYGIWLQLILILKRKQYVAAVTSRMERARGGATALLSLNHFTVRFVAFFAIALYGASLDAFNHFLVWSHLVGALLLLGIITEIYRERGDGISLAMLLMCSALLFLGMIAWAIIEETFQV